MNATIGPMFEPDYINQFRMYMEAKEVLTKGGEGSYNTLFTHIKKLLDELDMENKGVVEKMYLSGRLKGHV